MRHPRAPITTVMILFAAAASGCAAGPASSDASLTTGGCSGRIAFTALRHEEPASEPTAIAIGAPNPGPPSQLYSVRPDGSCLRRLTDDPTFKGSIAWSPTDDLFAFTAFDVDRLTEELLTMRPDGSDRRVICEACTGTFYVPPGGEECGIEGCGPVHDPSPFDVLAWSPDGRWIATRQTWDSGLAIIDMTTGRAQTFDTTGTVWGTSWSPDGRSVAFIVEATGLFVLDVESGDIHQLVDADPAVGSPPAWSPDGSSIAFPRVAHVGGDLYATLVLVDPVTGQGRTILGSDKLFWIYDLDWAPDGSRLAVMHHPVHPATAGLLTIAPDGSDTQMVALCDDGSDSDGLCPANGGNVDWSPDGSAFVFLNFDGARLTLTVATLDGHATPVSGDLVPSCCLAWQS